MKPATAPALDLRQQLRNIYTAELGVREATKRNDGPQVEQYLRYVGLPAGNPWCAAFVCWALGKAGLEHPRTGWSPALFPEAKLKWKRSRILSVDLPGQAAGVPVRSGDVFGIYYPEKKRIAHCGFVDKWDGSWLITVEGNTNTSGSREGDGVYRKRRLVGTVYAVADWVGGADGFTKGRE